MLILDVNVKKRCFNVEKTMYFLEYPTSAALIKQPLPPRCVRVKKNNFKAKDPHSSIW